VGAIYGPGPLVRCVLAARWLRILKCLECGGNVVGHGEVDGVISVVPVKSETTVETTGLVGAYYVQVFKGCD
jgi:hypothetical protein